MRIHKITDDLWAVYDVAAHHITGHIERHWRDGRYVFEMARIGCHHEPIDIREFGSLEAAIAALHS